jgi:hypothetical protein
MAVGCELLSAVCLQFRPDVTRPTTAPRSSFAARQAAPRAGRRPVSGRIRSIWCDHGLSIALTAMFAITLAGQVWTGLYVYNDDRHDHGQPPVTLSGYVRTGHFGEATFENFESEFLQMACYVILTVFLYQRGSAESKRPGVLEPVDLDPAESLRKADAPWPVRKGGVILRLYQHSLSIAFATLFAVSFGLHARTGLVNYNDERRVHGQPSATVSEFLSSSQFWFESLQNWQSEFLSLAAMVTFTIFLRQRGSPESKPVDAPTWDTGY